MKQKKLLVVIAALAFLGFRTPAVADEVFSNLQQTGTGNWLAAENAEFGTTFHTGAGSFGLDRLTLEELFYDPLSAASLKVRILQVTPDGFSPVGEFGNAVALDTPTELPGITTYISLTPLAPITVSPNAEYLIAVSTAPGTILPALVRTSLSNGYASSVGWQLGSDWEGLFFGEEFWFNNDSAGHLKFSVEATLSPNQPPDVSEAFAQNGVVWPPSGNLVPVEIFGVSDPDGDNVQIIVTRIEQDEPVVSGATGDTGPDGIIDSNGNAWIRAQRDASGNGRVYKVYFSAKDGNPGGDVDGFVYVTVPHDRGRGAIAIDDGPVTGYFDSTQP
jgi:hypothetical protein